MGVDIGDHYDQVLAGTSFPAVSAASKARLTYMSSFRTLVVSENASAFVYPGIPLSWGATSPGTNRFFGSWKFVANASENRTQIICPVAGSLYGLCVQTIDGANFSGNCVFTIRKNGVNTTLTATGSNVKHLVTDLVHTTTVVRGDLISLEITSVASGQTLWGTVYLAPGQ